MSIKKRMFAFVRVKCYNRTAVLLRSVLVLFAVIVCLSGCNLSPSVKNASEIMEELSINKYYQETFPDLGIQNIEIVKRQTDIENKLDKVYVTLSVISKDEAVEGYIDMVVYYGLYNDMWSLDDCEVDYERVNEGTRFHPIKELDISLEDLSSILNLNTGEEYTDISIYSCETDLKNGVATYSVTATSDNTYMTEKIDATITFPFNHSAGCWEAPMLEMNNVEEFWHIDNVFDYSSHFRKVVIEVNGAIESFSVGYNDHDEGLKEWISDVDIYNTSDITLEKVMEEFFYELDNSDPKHNYTYKAEEYLTHYDFSVTMNGPFTDLYSFEYVVLLDQVGHPGDGILFVGRDKIAGFLWQHEHKIDTYNRRIVIDINELVPLY